MSSVVHGNGNQPPSPNTAAAAMPMPAAANGAVRRQPADGSQATASRSRKAPASGLAHPVAAARTTVQTRRSSRAAARAPTPAATPSANGSRPTTRLTTLMTANQTTATSWPVRRLPRSSRVKAAVAAMHDSAPSSRAPMTAAIGGKSSE